MIKSEYLELTGHEFVFLLKSIGISQRSLSLRMNEEGSPSYIFNKMRTQNLANKNILFKCYHEIGGDLYALGYHYLELERIRRQELIAVQKSNNTVEPLDQKKKVDETEAIYEGQKKWIKS